MISVLTHSLRRRRTGLTGWSLALLAAVALLAVAYPTVRDNTELDRTFAGLSPGVRQVLGLAEGSGLTSPAGYLASQYFANLLPVLLLVFTIGTATWSIAGDEDAGTLELLLANPISRTQVATARMLALIAMTTLLAGVSAIGLVALAPLVDLTHGLPPWRLAAATLATALLALCYAALAFAVGAGTGNRTATLSTAGALAAAGYLVEGLASAVPVLRPVRTVTPWHWLLDDDPLYHGLTAQNTLLPLAVTLALGAIGLLAFRHRDLA